MYRKEKVIDVTVNLLIIQYAIYKLFP